MLSKSLLCYRLTIKTLLVKSLPTLHRESIGQICHPLCFQGMAPLWKGISSNMKYHDDDCSEFGSLAEKHGLSVFDLPAEEETERFLNNEPADQLLDKNTAFWYHIKCKKLARSGRVEECVNMLLNQMLQVEKVKPQEYNFSVVIGAVGTTGNTKLAFKLFRTLKEYGLQPTLPVYTSLFNAVANSKDSSDLKKAKRLYEKLKEGGVNLNIFAYNAAIKAFAKHSTFQEVSMVLKDCITSGIEPDSYTISGMLQSCQKDIECGTRKAIQVWQYMLALGIKPDARNITNLLQVIEKCEIGDPSLATSLLLVNPPSPSLENAFKNHVRQFRWLPGQVSKPRPQEEKSLPPPGQDIFSVDYLNVENIVENPETKTIASIDPTVNNSAIGNLPNLLDVYHRSESTSVIALASCPTPADRLALLGGYRGVIKFMEDNSLPVSNQTLTQLMKLMPNDDQDEEQLMKYGERCKSLALDVDFYNFVLRKRAKRGWVWGALQVYKRMCDLNLSPNARTWSIKAMLCYNWRDTIELFNDMESHGASGNVVLYHTLIANTFKMKKRRVTGYTHVYSLNYPYLIFLITKMQQESVNANRPIITLLDRAVKWAPGYNRWEKNDPKYEREMKQFRKVYTDWLKLVKFSPD